MTVTRLTSIAPLIANWPFYSRGLLASSRYLKLNQSLDVLRRIVFYLVRSKRGWVAVAGETKAECFCVAHDCTPLFSERVEWEISILYHQPGHDEATRALLEAFEHFCRNNNVCQINIPTRRGSGSAERWFAGLRYGIQRGYTVFTKELQ